MSTSLRIARGMKQFAETALAALEQLPDDVRSDSISVLPEILNFEDPLDIEILYDEE
jgi:predicted Zn-dependent protease with MMP-like domain